MRGIVRQIFADVNGADEIGAPAEPQIEIRGLQTERGQIRAFDVAADGSLSNGRIFTADAPGADGMKVDLEGNVYCACKPGVMIFDRTGKHLHTYTLADQPTNLAFGDGDWKTLYITARPSLYRVGATVPGIKLP